MGVTGLLIIFMFTITSVIYDAGILNSGKFIYNHRGRFIIRSLFFSLFFLFSWVWVIAAALFFSSTFDLLLNYARYKSLFHLGTTAKWDIFWRKRKTLYIIALPLMFILSIYLFSL